MKTQIFPLLRAGEIIREMDFLQTRLLLVVRNQENVTCKLICFDILRDIELWRVDTLFDGQIQKNHDKNEILVASATAWCFYSSDGVLIKEIILSARQYPCRATRFTTISFSKQLSHLRHFHWTVQEPGNSSHFFIEQGKEEKKGYINGHRWYLPEEISQKFPLYHVWRDRLFVYRLGDKRRSLCLQKEVLFNHISDLLFLPSQKSLLILDASAEEIVRVPSQQLCDWREEEGRKDETKKFKLWRDPLRLQGCSKLRLWNDKFVCLLTTWKEQKISLYDCNTFE